MKSWSDDHPKAKLMDRKRAAILAAARSTFLRLGYEGSSMEAIAAAADVSIMTLYRHAKSKDDLFAAVIGNVCDMSDEAERARIEAGLRLPLGEILVGLGMECQQRLADPETVSLMRVVMAETARFPKLAESAYEGFFGHWEEIVANVLGLKDESRFLSDAQRKSLSKAFIDALFGADVFRVLLGLGGYSEDLQHVRAQRASDELMVAIGTLGASDC
jgi:TetR/AcrR family transcriptional repressor of mexJK operon